MISLVLVVGSATGCKSVRSLRDNTHRCVILGHGNVAHLIWRRLLAGRCSDLGSRSILRGFPKVGSNFLPLGTPHLWLGFERKEVPTGIIFLGESVFQFYEFV